MLVGAISGLGLIAAQYLRNTSVTDRVWAEDGAVFGRQAFESHVWQQVGRGYAGYLVAPERVLAAPIVSVVPPGRWGQWFAVSAMAVAAFAALSVYRLSGGILRSWPIRAALALLVAVGPKMRGEWPAIANVGWPLLVVMFWVIVSVRSDALSTVLRCVIAALATTASGLALAFVPLAVVVLGGRDLPIVTRFLDRSSLAGSTQQQTSLRRADRWVALVIAIASLLQIVGIFTAVAGPKPFRSTPADIGRLLMVRVFGSVLVGERLVDDAWKKWGLAFAVIAVMIVIVGLLAITFRSLRTTQSLVLMAVGYAVAIGAASLRTRGTEPFALQPHQFTFDADRYFIIPAFLVMSAVAIAIDQHRGAPDTNSDTVVVGGGGSSGGGGSGLSAVAAPQAPYRSQPVVAYVFAGFVALVLVATGFTLKNPEQPSDPWSLAVRNAKATCVADPGLIRVDIPIAPAGIFRLTVPCSRLR